MTALFFSNFPNMEKLEKGPKEIFSPDIQKVIINNLLMNTSRLKLT